MAKGPAGLSDAQRACLADAAEGRLVRQRHGWASVGYRGHQTGTVEALARRGLLKVDALAAICGAATITTAGRKVLAEIANA